MKNLADLRRIKESVVAELLKRPGVGGVDIGYKIVGGRKTEELAVRILVKQKKDVPQNQRIPKEIEGAKTDVIQRTFELHPLLVRVADFEVKSDTTKYGTLKGGVSIGPCRSIWMEPPDVPAAGWYTVVGTLGAIVKDKATGDPMLLSNFHVMCVNTGWSAGDTMAQPGRPDGGSCPGDVVGALQRASLGGKVDCAVSSHTARPYACEIVDIGTVTGTGAASAGMAVRKRGRTTGLTYGTVDTVDLTVKIDYGNGLGEITLTNQIGIDVDASHSAQFGTHGDSGSALVDNNRKVVGLYFAGSTDGSYGVANPIQAVLDELNISICTPVVKKIEIKEHKFEKFERKELKREWKELKELRFEKRPKELFEKEWVEGKGLREDIPWLPGQPGQPGPIAGGGMQERVSQLEATLGQKSPKPERKEVIKERKEWIKEKREKPEIKERLKDIKEKEKDKEKEFKEKDKELKEKELKEKEFKEDWDKPIKEKDKDKDLVEGGPEFPEQPYGAGSLEARIAALESAIAQLLHFIPGEDRPDLAGGALSNEPDIGGSKTEKDLKDAKDTEKAGEGMY